MTSLRWFVINWWPMLLCYFFFWLVMYVASGHDATWLYKIVVRSVLIALERLMTFGGMIQ